MTEERLLTRDEINQIELHKHWHGNAFSFRNYALEIAKAQDEKTARTILYPDKGKIENIILDGLIIGESSCSWGSSVRLKEDIVDKVIEAIRGE